MEKSSPSYRERYNALHKREIAFAKAFQLTARVLKKLGCVVLMTGVMAGAMVSLIGVCCVDSENLWIPFYMIFGGAFVCGSLAAILNVTYKLSEKRAAKEERRRARVTEMIRRTREMKYPDSPVEVLKDVC